MGGLDWLEKARQLEKKKNLKKPKFLEKQDEKGTVFTHWKGPYYISIIWQEMCWL